MGLPLSPDSAIAATKGISPKKGMFKFVAKLSALPFPKM